MDCAVSSVAVLKSAGGSRHNNGPWVTGTLPGELEWMCCQRGLSGILSVALIGICVINYVHYIL